MRSFLTVLLATAALFGAVPGGGAALAEVPPGAAAGGAPGATMRADEAPTPLVQRAATLAAAEGRPAEALALAEILLRRDPKDPLAHFIVARIMAQTRQTGVARQAAAKAFRYAESPRQHYEAARLSAQIALGENRMQAAQYWARQTIQHAPDARYRAQGVNDYRRLRATNPLRWRLSLGLKPSNNVNGGADERYNVIDGFDAVGILSDDAMALGGIIGTASFGVDYRVARSARSETSLGFTGYLKAVELWGVPVAEALVPPGVTPPPPRPIKNSDFSAAAFGLRAQHAMSLGKGASLSFAGELGQVWQGGEPSYRYQQISARGAMPVTQEAPERPGISASFGGLLERRDYASSAREDIRSSLDLGLRRGKVALGFGLSQTQSDSINARNWSVSANLRYEPDWTIGPMHMSLAAGASKTVYPDFVVVIFHPPGGRQDETIYGELGLWSPKIGTAGFSPEMKLRAVRTESNVSRYSNTEVSVALGLRSTF